MNNGAQDEPNAPANHVQEGRSPSYQASADPAEPIEKYPSQPGVDLRVPAVSSDSQNGLQNQPQNELQTNPENHQVPLESFERETSPHCEQPNAVQNAHEGQADGDPELPALALSPGQQKTDQYGLAAPESQGAQLDLKTLHTTISNAGVPTQTIQDTAEAPEKNVDATGAAVLGAPANGLAGAPHPDAELGGARPTTDNPTSSQFDFEKNEKGDRESVLPDARRVAEKIQEVDQELGKVIQSIQIEKRADKSAESSPFQGNESQPTGRAQRQCVKNTPNYSHTHKGITAMATTKSKCSTNERTRPNHVQLSSPPDVSPFETDVKDSKLETKELDEAAAKAPKPGAEERKGNPADGKNRLAGKRSYEEICRSYESMFAFDWELRDINNLRHPPDREVTPIVVWFYINVLYFPYNAQDLAKVPFEQFVRPIFDSLERVADLTGEAHLPLVGSGEAAPGKDQSYPASQSGQSEMLVDEGHPGEKPTDQGSMSQVVATTNAGEDLAWPVLPHHHEDGGQPELIQKLQIEEHFFEFRDMFREEMTAIMDRVGGTGSDGEDQAMGGDSEDGGLAELLPENEEDRDEALLDMLLSRFESNLASLRTNNESELRKQYANFTSAYKLADEKANLIIQGRKDLAPRLQFPYNPTKLHEYGLDFLSYVDPYFVADVQENYEWYLQNQNEVLLNVSYPSKQEKQFLRHIEQWQQEKNDLNYKRILQQLEEGADDPDGGPNGLNIQRYNSLSAHKRGLIVQEDAQCAICNNGDYEDEDLIVFCGACNIPVHQRCYGIDKIPEEDWLCNNCDAFYMRRGIMVKCILCPKRGGAMKPTSIFRTYEHFMHYHTAAQKKKGLQHSNYFASLASSRNQQEGNSKEDHKAIEDQNASQPDELANSQITQQLSQDQQVAQQSLLLTKQASSGRSHRFQFFEREDKNHALSQILSREKNFQNELAKLTYTTRDQFPQNNVDLHFLESESITEIPEDYTFFLQRNEQRLEDPATVPTETLYEWVHLSCAMWIPGPSVTPKTPVRMSKIDVKRFDLQCIICGKRHGGACIQCQHARCMISFHIECARRANYFLEVERVDRERNYRVFCEKHRPLKIVREMEEKDKQTLEEVQKFSKVIDRCFDIYARAEAKQLRQKRLQPFSKPAAPEPPSRRELIAEKKQQRLSQQKQKKLAKESEMMAKKEQARVKKEQEREEKEQVKKQKREAAMAAVQKKHLNVHQVAKPVHTAPSKRRTGTLKAVEPKQHREPAEPVNTAPVAVKWKDKDRKVLFERVREKFLQLFKLRLNVQHVDPMVKINKKKELLQKKNEKEQRKIEKKRRDKLTKKFAESVNKKTAPFSIQRSGLRSRSTVIDPQTGAEIDQAEPADADYSGQQPDEMNGVQEKKEDAGAEDHEFFATGENNAADGRDESGESDNENRRPKIGELVAPEGVDPYYKFASPSTVQELDWAITFSKYDFPWHEVKFDKFSAKSCYKTYTAIVRSAQTFFKKILGGKEKYKKFIASQLDEAQRVFFGQNVEDQAPNQPLALQAAETVAEGGNESDIELFCKCRGEFQSQTGYFVMCEAEDDCVNGGWLHPECTSDLFHLTQDEIMNLDKWYCEDCLVKQNPQTQSSQQQKEKGLSEKKQKPASQPDHAEAPYGSNGKIDFIPASSTVVVPTFTPPSLQKQLQAALQQKNPQASLLASVIPTLAQKPLQNSGASVVTPAEILVQPVRPPLIHQAQPTTLSQKIAQLNNQSQNAPAPVFKFPSATPHLPPLPRGLQQPLEMSAALAVSNLVARSNPSSEVSQQMPPPQQTQSLSQILNPESQGAPMNLSSSKVTLNFGKFTNLPSLGATNPNPANGPGANNH